MFTLLHVVRMLVIGDEVGGCHEYKIQLTLTRLICAPSFNFPFQVELSIGRTFLVFRCERKFSQVKQTIQQQTANQLRALMF